MINTERRDPASRTRSWEQSNKLASTMRNIPAQVVTVSDRAAASARADSSGPVAVAELRAAGFACPDAMIIPDGADQVEQALRQALAAGARVIITTGGTGIAPRDRTPEGTARVIETQLPGIAERLRAAAAEQVPTAILSRGLAGITQKSLIVNLPGSPGGVRDGMAVVCAVAAHILEQLDGADHL